MELIAAIQKISDVVTSTLGAKGRLVLLNKRGQVYATKDGVTVAEHLNFEDGVENKAAYLIKQAARATADAAGDGTTTTVLLLNALINNIMQLQPTNIYKLIEGLNIAQHDFEKYIDSMKQKIDLDKIYNVAYTSSNNNAEIATSIRKIYEVLNDWSINVSIEKGDDIKDSAIIHSGYNINHKAFSPVTLSENAFVFLINDKITKVSMNLGETIFKAAGENKEDVLLICREFTEDVIEYFNGDFRERYNINVSLVKIDLYGHTAYNMFYDMAEYLNCKVIEGGLEKPYSLNDVSFPGTKVKKIIYDIDKTIIQKSSGIDDTDEDKENYQRLKNYIDVLEEELTNTKDFAEVHNLEQRIAKLKSEICTYVVGGSIISEIEERYDRIEDALLAVKAAIRNGVVYGGAYVYNNFYDSEFNSLIKSREKLNDTNLALGYLAVTRTLHAVYAKLLSNAGYTPEMIQLLPESIYNVSTDSVELVKHTIIYDTANTQIQALKNAIGVAKTVFLTNYIIN